MVTPEDWATRYGSGLHGRRGGAVGAGGNRRAVGASAGTASAAAARLPGVALSAVQRALPVAVRRQRSAARRRSAALSVAGFDRRRAVDRELFRTMRCSSATWRSPPSGCRTWSAGLRMDVMRWQAADALSDIQAAAWVEQHFRDMKLFHTAGHLTAAPIAFMLRQLLERTDDRAAWRPDALAWRDRHAAARCMTGRISRACRSIRWLPSACNCGSMTRMPATAGMRMNGRSAKYILHYARWAPYLGLMLASTRAPALRRRDLRQPITWLPACERNICSYNATNI